MITMKEWMELVEYKITEGSDYGWNCFGTTSYQLSHWNGVHGPGGYSFNIVFDTETQEVYTVEVCDYTRDRAYRMINPDHLEIYNQEASYLGIRANEAWDNVDFVDLEVADDFIQKALAIKSGEDYDTRVSIPLDIPESELLKYMTMAHERDMTFNQFVEEALRSALADLARDPESVKARVQQWKAEHALDTNPSFVPSQDC